MIESNEKIILGICSRCGVSHILYQENKLCIQCIKIKKCLYELC